MLEMTKMKLSGGDTARKDKILIPLRELYKWQGRSRYQWQLDLTWLEKQGIRVVTKR